MDAMKKNGTEVGTIVTFDDYGVSGHPNHISTYIGCKQIYDKGKYPIDLYTLESVNIIRKFIAYFDIFITNKDQ